MLSIDRVETERDTWTVGRWSPMPGDVLYGFVEGIFYWHGLPERPRERVFPNGRASLIVQLDDCYRPGTGNLRDPYPALCIDGMYAAPLVVEAPPRRARVIGVSLTPIGAVKILNRSLGEVNGVTNSLDDVVGKTAHELGEQVSTSRGVRAAMASTVAWVRLRVNRSREVAAEVQWLVNEIDTTNGNIAVRELMASASASPSRLSGAFTSHLGMSPKRFARVVRFRRAINLLSSAAKPFADIAVLAGYYDQPHFNTEFKLHSGMTPSQFLAAARFPGSVSLSEGSWDVFSKTAPG